jgi:hypothetical protein
MLQGFFYPLSFWRARWINQVTLLPLQFRLNRLFLEAFLQPEILSLINKEKALFILECLFD